MHEEDPVIVWDDLKRHQAKKLWTRARLAPWSLSEEEFDLVMEDRRLHRHERWAMHMRRLEYKSRHAEPELARIVARLILAIIHDNTTEKKRLERRLRALTGPLRRVK